MLTSEPNGAQFPTLLAALLAGVAGALAGWAVAVLVASAAGIGSGEDMRAFVVIGPAGAVAGFFIAVALTLYVKGGFRSFGEIAARSLAVTAMLGVTVAGLYGLRAATLAHLGVNVAAPAVEFEIRLPPTTASAALGRTAQAGFQSEFQVELLTDRNQALARLDQPLWPTSDGRTVLKGTVPLEFRTSDRMVVLSLPGQGQRLFKLRLPAEPTRSAEFGPWHLADRVIPPGVSPSSAPDDAYAIRYRVL